MNCGCLLKGNPFDGNQTILEACVLHLAWAGEKLRETQLQNDVMARVLAEIHPIDRCPYNDYGTCGPCNIQAKVKYVEKRKCEVKYQHNCTAENCEKTCGHDLPCPYHTEKREGRP